MREILFRGKQIGNGEWVEGFYYKAKWCIADEILSHYITVPHPECNGQPSDHFMVRPETVGQYTGLTDKNGKKIFEGDIVKIGSFMPGADDWVCVIEWDYALFEEYKYVWNTKCEVIGNIHDNPELLEDSQ